MSFEVSPVSANMTSCRLKLLVARPLRRPLSSRFESQAKPLKLFQEAKIGVVVAFSFLQHLDLS